MFESVKNRFKPSDGSPLPFASTLDDFKGKLKQVTENRKMGADLLFMITYMNSLAIANATRNEIFSFAANRKEYISSKYIANVDKYVTKWSYSYAESLSLVAERTKNDILKNLLMRYSNAIESGVPDDEFLKNELSATRSIYRSKVEEGLEMLKKWGDAYVAMLLSGTVIAVTIMISIAIYSPAGMETTVGVSYAIVLVICIFGNLLMYTSVPDDPKTHGLMERPSKEQQMIYSLERINIILAIIAIITMLALGINYGLIFLLVGILMAPLGIIGYIDDKNISFRDRDFSTFIRSFGSVMGGQSSTAVQALSAIDRKALAALEHLLNSVYSKMNLGLDDREIWDKYIGQAGSDLIYKYLNIYLDIVKMGGPPEPIGSVVGSSMLEQVLLREKKDLHAKSFIVLLIPMHIAMTGIFVSLYTIMVVLTGSVATMMTHFREVSAAAGGSAGAGIAAGSAVGGSINMFSNFPEGPMMTFVVITLTIITISNILAARIVGGGDRYMYYFYAAIFCILTGLVLLITPIGVHMFFSAEGLKSMAGAGTVATGASV